MRMTHDRDDGQSAPVATVASTGAGAADCCEPCDIPVFCRNYYYHGKLLTEREFADEQRYFINKLRLHKVALHGWGVACGLHVKPHPYCPELRLVVEEGLAIDSCGRDIRVLKEGTIDLPPPSRPPRPHYERPPEDNDRHRADSHREDGYREEDRREEGQIARPVMVGAKEIPDGRLALGEAVDLVIEHKIVYVKILPHQMDEMVSSNRQRVTIS